MNTEQFRQRALADPWDQDPDFLAARDADDTNAAFLEELQGLDRQLAEVMKVPVPDGLSERILARAMGDADVQAAPELPPADAAKRDPGDPDTGNLQDELAQRRARTQLKNQGPFQRFALAASLVLSIGVAAFMGYRFYELQYQFDDLQSAVLAHSTHEPHSWFTKATLKRSDVQKVLLGFGGRLTRDIPATYVNRCRLRHYDGVHLVVQEQGIPVTVYFMNKEHVDREITADDGEYLTVMMPGNDRGSWAAVVHEGQDPTIARTAMHRVSDAVEWRL
ncbi:MAG: DUF3379 family protein [Gammaproteobacteria bacterium]